MSKKFVDAPSFAGFKVEPEKLAVITDAAHPLYDERTKLKLDEWLVKNIMVYGVLQPIKVRKNGDVLEVVDGRRRVVHAVEANKRLVAAGASPIRVPILSTAHDDLETFSQMIIHNRHRVDDGPLLNARNAQKLIDKGKTEEEIATIFGVTKVAVGQWLKLITLSSKVQKAVEDGKLSASAASKLAGLERGEQDEALDELISESEGGEKKVTAKKVAKKAAKGGIEAPGKRLLIRLYETPDNDIIDAEDKKLIGWILGRETAEDCGIDKTIAAIEEREKSRALDAKIQKEQARDEAKALKEKERDEARAKKEFDREAKKAAKLAEKLKKESQKDSLADAGKKVSNAAKKRGKKVIEPSFEEAVTA